MLARVQGVVDRVTDGDTVRVRAEGRLLKLRVLGLDAEESNPDSPKPVTDWGRRATRFAAELLPPGRPVTVVFPGEAAPFLADGQIRRRYLDNHARPLGFLGLAEPVGGVSDFSELMIRKGFSPYFVKYGRVEDADRNRAYAAAEIAAQQDDLGVWNPRAANGVDDPLAAPRNYAQLMVWWELRARIIDGFRAARAQGAPVLSARLDYPELVRRAGAGLTATVFMELREARAVGGAHFVFTTGSRAQPFQLFLRDAAQAEIQEVLRLARNRYVSGGDALPRRNYAYVTGPLSLFVRGEAEIVEMAVRSAGQIADAPPAG